MDEALQLSRLLRGHVLTANTATRIDERESIAVCWLRLTACRSRGQLETMVTQLDHFARGASQKCHVELSAWYSSL